MRGRKEKPRNLSVPAEQMWPEGDSNEPPVIASKGAIRETLEKGIEQGHSQGFF